MELTDYQAQSIYDDIDVLIDRIHFVADSVCSYMKAASEEGLTPDKHRIVSFGAQAEDQLNYCCERLEDIMEKICPHDIEEDEEEE